MKNLLLKIWLILLTLLVISSCERGDDKSNESQACSKAESSIFEENSIGIIQEGASFRCTSYEPKPIYVSDAMTWMDSLMQLVVNNKDDDYCALYSIFAARFGNELYSQIVGGLDRHTESAIQGHDTTVIKQIYLLSLVISPVSPRENYRRDLIRKRFQTLIESDFFNNLLDQDAVLAFCRKFHKVPGKFITPEYLSAKRKFLTRTNR